MSEALDARCQWFLDQVALRQDFHEAMELESRFCWKLDHYYERRADEPDRIKVRGRQTKQLGKHVVGSILKPKVFLDVRPQDDEQMEPEQAEMAKKALEYQLFHSPANYKKPRAYMVMQAVAARMSGVEFEFDPEVGVWGEICATWRDGRTIMWDEEYISPHDPRCPRVAIAFRMRVSQIQAMAKGDDWNNTDDLKPDEGYLQGGQQRQNSALLDALNSGAPSVQDVETKDGFVTVVKMWERGVKDTEKRTVEASFRKLPTAERYHLCKACEWRGPTQAQTDKPLDQFAFCPTCGQVAERQDGEELDETVLAYRKGRRFTIFAPYAKREFVHLKKWPYDTSEIPLVAFQYDPFPGDPIGGSITHDHRTMQCAANKLMRLGLEHMDLAKPYVNMPSGARTFDGRPYEFGVEDGLGIYFDPDTPLAERQMQIIQSAGLPAAWPALDASFENKFRSYTGTTDLGLSPQQSKDIPASTIAQYVEQGEIPVQEAINRLQDDETPAFQAVYEMIRATYTPARWIAFQGEDGRWVSEQIQGDFLPRINVMVTASPDTARMDLEQLQHWERFAMAPPALREFYAKRLNVPISEVRRLQEIEQRMAMEQESRDAEVYDRAEQGDPQAIQLVKQRQRQQQQQQMQGSKNGAGPSRAMQGA